VRDVTSVLVTGAAGFLGRWFVREHVARGDHVIGVDDLSNPHSFWPDELDALRRYQLDAGQWFKQGLNARPDDEIGLTKWDIAYHFAAPVGGREKIEGDPLFNANSLVLDSLFFRWAVKRAAIAVYPSSSAVYGTELQEGHGQLLCEEYVEPNAQFWKPPDQMYGLTKLVGEYLAWCSEAYGLNTLCIRPFSGYGEGQSLEYPIPSILTRAKAKENPLTIWGTGEQTRDFIHVSDLVGATLARLDRGVHGYQTMNIASGLQTSFLEVARLAADIVGYRPEIKRDTTKPSGVSSRFGSVARMSRYYTPHVSLREGLTRVLEGL
jgi:UDP-glucose 4-epimerase